MEDAKRVSIQSSTSFTQKTGYVQSAGYVHEVTQSGMK